MDEHRLARLEDLDAIRALKGRYARFADAGYDADGIASLFVPDGVWDGGSLFGRAEGVDAIRAHFAGASARIPWALHYVIAPEIEVAGDGRSATGSWYLWQPCTRRSSSGEERPAWLAGTYADRYVKVDGRWLFEHLRVDARWLDGPVAAVPSS
jgi:uncharacterized protein (TIGR02246 family)